MLWPAANQHMVIPVFVITRFAGGAVFARKTFESPRCAPCRGERTGMLVRGGGDTSDDYDDAPRWSERKGRGKSRRRLVRVYPVPVNWTVAPFRMYPPLPSCLTKAGCLWTSRSTEIGRISRWMATPAESINTANVRKIRKILHTSLADMICLSSVWKGLLRTSPKRRSKKFG